MSSTQVGLAQNETRGFVSHDPAFEAVLGPAPRLVRVTHTDAHEGPVYVGEDDALYFTTAPQRRRGDVSTVPAVAIMRLSLDGERFPLEPKRLSLVRYSARAANGMTLDFDHGLIVCEQGAPTEPAAITRLDLASLEFETLIESVGGEPLNSPNDVVVKSDGTIWFTDPSYGYLQGFRPKPRMADCVYRYDPRSCAIEAVADSLDKPNGLAFSPDEAILYVGDSGANQERGSYYPDRPHEIRAFEVADDERLENERSFATVSPGFPDGLKVDSAGRVYASSFSGVQVFTPDGELIGEIRLAGAVNFTWGGAEGRILFITSDDAVWAAELAAHTPRTGQRPTGDT